MTPYVAKRSHHNSCKCYSCKSYRPKDIRRGLKKAARRQQRHVIDRIDYIDIIELEDGTY